MGPGLIWDTGIKNAVRSPFAKTHDLEFHTSIKSAHDPNANNTPTTQIDPTSSLADTCITILCY